MPHAAFSSECRTPKNAESIVWGLNFGLVADHGLGIV
jgi:hypothetical protein